MYDEWKRNTTLEALVEVLDILSVVLLVLVLLLTATFYAWLLNTISGLTALHILIVVVSLGVPAGYAWYEFAKDFDEERLRLTKRYKEKKWK